MFHTTRNADGIWYLTKANDDGNGYEVISTHFTEDDANDAMREQEDATTCLYCDGTGNDDSVYGCAACDGTGNAPNADTTRA